MRKRNFGQNLIFFSAAVALKIRSRSPKFNQLFSPSKQCIYASLVKIHPLVQKIMSRKDATQTSTQTGSAPKPICPSPFRKFAFHIFDQVRHKTICAAEETRKRLEILDVEMRHTALSQQLTLKVDYLQTCLHLCCSVMLRHVFF